MSWILKHNPTAIQNAGDKMTYGEWPIGQFAIQLCRTSSRNEMAKNFILIDASGASIECSGDIRDFSKEVRSLPFLTNGTFDYKNWKFSCTVDGRPEFIPAVAVE